MDNFVLPQKLESPITTAARGEVISSAQITIDGKDYGMQQVEVSSGCSSELPGRLGVAQSFSQGVGTITWDMPQDSSVNFVTMLCGKPGAEDAFTIPPVGASVSIQMGRSPSLEGQALKKVLTGRVDSHEIDPQTGGLITKIVDEWDRFSETVRVLANTAWMPNDPDSDGPPFPCAASVSAYVWNILEQCGYSPTARSKLPIGTDTATLVYAPLQGSALVNEKRGHGILVDVNGGTSWRENQGTPTFAYYYFGRLFFQKGFITYETNPNTIDNYYDSATKDFFVRGQIGPGHNGVVNINIYSVKDNRRVSVPIRIEADGTLHAGRVEKAGKVPKNGRFEVKISTQRWEANFSDGTQAYGKFDVAPEVNSKVYAIEIVGHSGKPELADVHVFGRDLPFADRRQAFVAIPSEAIATGFVKSCRDRVARDALEEVGQAFGMPMWVDGEGRFHFRALTQLDKEGVAYSIPKDEIVDYNLKLDLLRCASKISVRYIVPAYNDLPAHGNETYVKVYEGTNAQVKPGERQTEIFSIPDTEEWFGIDKQPADYDFIQMWGAPWKDIPSGEAWRVSNMNKIIGKAYTRSVDYTIDPAVGYPGYWTRPVIRDITPWVFEMTSDYSQYRGNVLERRFPTQRELTIFEDMSGWRMPLIRAARKVEYGNNSSTITVEVGKNGAPVFEHNMGVWGESMEKAERIGNSFKKYLQNTVWCDRLTVMFNPAYEIGKKVRVELPEGGTFTMIILGVEQRPADGVTTLTTRVIPS